MFIHDGKFDIMSNYNESNELNIFTAHTEKQYVLNETDQRLYYRVSYFFAKYLSSFLTSSLCFIAFALPACSMAGLGWLHNDLFPYLAFVVGYLHSIRMASLFCSWTFDTKARASTAFGVLFTILALTSGTTIHFKDLSPVTKWLYPVTPLRWTHEALVGWEFSSNITLTLGGGAIVPAAQQSNWVFAGLPFLCSHNPIIQQENAILIKADCGFQSRSNILNWFNYKGGSVSQTDASPSLRSYTHPLISDSAVFCVFSFLSLMSFLFIARRKSDGSCRASPVAVVSS
jgi:hypothetical protein